MGCDQESKATKSRQRASFPIADQIIAVFSFAYSCTDVCSLLGYADCIIRYDVIDILLKFFRRIPLSILKISPQGFKFCVLRDQLKHSLMLCLVLDIATKSTLLAEQS